MSLLKKYNELMKVILGINENIHKKRFEKNVRGVPIVCLTLNTNTHKNGCCFKCQSYGALNTPHFFTHLKTCQQSRTI